MHHTPPYLLQSGSTSLVPGASNASPAHRQRLLLDDLLDVITQLDEHQAEVYPVNCDRHVNASIGSSSRQEFASSIGALVVNDGPAQDDTVQDPSAVTKDSSDRK
jgi:hypothetical protein